MLSLAVNNDVLAIRPADLSPSAPFDTPAVMGPAIAPRPARAAVAARGGRGANRARAVAAQAAVPGAPGAVITPAVSGPARLRYLSLATLTSFVDSSNPIAPLTGLAFFLGHLGSTLTSACRADDSGILQSAAEIVRHELTAKFGDVLGESALARQLPGFVNMVAANFTSLFSSDSFEPAVLEAQLSSAVRLLIGSADERSSIERHRAIFAISRVRA